MLLYHCSYLSEQVLILREPVEHLQHVDKHLQKHSVAPDAEAQMGSCQKCGPFLGLFFFIRVPYYTGNPKSDPNLENYPNVEPQRP